MNGIPYLALKGELSGAFRELHVHEKNLPRYTESAPEIWLYSRVVNIP